MKPSEQASLWRLGLGLRGADQLQELMFGENLDAQGLGLLEFLTGVFTRDDQVGLAADARGDVAAALPDFLAGLLAGQDG